jgi:predicted signal transduction protein with EAL and GGDEF domain
VIAAIIAFAKAVGLSTTAECVEDAEQLARLREMGADRVQGYYCSRPVPPEKLEELLLTRDPLLQNVLKRARPESAGGRRRLTGSAWLRACPGRSEVRYSAQRLLFH